MICSSGVQTRFLNIFLSFNYRHSREIGSDFDFYVGVWYNWSGSDIMEFIKSTEIKELSNPGVVSRQLLNPDNSESKRVTITEVHLEVGACQPRHTHDASEQIWYAVKGCGTLLLENDTTMPFNVGDVVRFADKDVHGLLNDGDEEFIYISVTAPPIHFGYAYRDEK